MAAEKHEESLERAIAGALRSAIHDHGPVTPETIGSAVKRIMGNLRNARITGLAVEMNRRRWAGVSERERATHQAEAARSYWAGMSPRKRSDEMKRRAAKRAKKPSD